MRLLCSVGLSLALTGTAQADLVGIQAPPGWTRGDASTAFADFDSFAGFSGGIGSVVPGAQSGFAAASLAQAGAIVPPGGLFAGGDRLYIHADDMLWTLTATTAFDVDFAVLQVKESQGSGLGSYTATLDGVAPTSVSFFNDGGAPADAITRYFWDLSGLASELTSLQFSLTGPEFSFTSFDAFALDVAASPVPLPAAAWLVGLPLAGLFVRARRAGA